jgi:enamine deaminase RidA (YjgF/YER057c/UK114 family)
MTVYVTDMDQYILHRRALGKTWVELMGKHFPAMALVQVVRLVDDTAQVEIEATAVVPAWKR